MSYSGQGYQQNDDQYYGRPPAQHYQQPPYQQQAPYQQQMYEQPGAGGYNPNVNSAGAPQGPPPNWNNRPQYPGPSNPQIVQQEQYRGNGPPPPPTGQQDFGANNMHFQYGNLQGKKKALLIGINYFRSKNELHGCINEYAVLYILSQ